MVEPYNVYNNFKRKITGGNLYKNQPNMDKPRPGKPVALWTSSLLIDSISLLNQAYPTALTGPH